MKYFFLTLFFMGYMASLPAQRLYQQQSNDNPDYFRKPPVDTTVFSSWPSVGDAPGISNDGRYCYYYVREHYYAQSATLVMQSTHDSWKKTLPDTRNAMFTEDSRKVICMKSTDSLCLLTLGSSDIEYIPRVESFKLFRHGEAECLAYQVAAPDRKLILRTLKTSKEQSFVNVRDYLLSPDGNILILLTALTKDTATIHSLSWVSLLDGASKVIWKGAEAGNLVVDDTGTQLAFAVEESHQDKEKSFWYYQQGGGKAVRLADSQSAGLDRDLRLDEIVRFSNDGSRLFVRLREKELPPPDPDAVKVDIWSYTDTQLQSQQLVELEPKSYLAVISVKEHAIIRLQKVGDITNFTHAGNDDLIFLYNRNGEIGEWNWNRAARASYFLVSAKTGKRDQVSGFHSYLFPELSPGGKYLIGLGNEGRDLYSYEIATGITRNLTRSLPIPVGSVEFDEPYLLKSRGLQVADWLANDSYVLVYDEFDIWQIDPVSKQPPVNITNGYGRKQNIIFRLGMDYSGKEISGNEHLLLSAFNNTNKENGFYRKVINEKGDPELLSTGHFLFYSPDHLLGFPPIKARDTAIYLVQRQSATQSPNYFSTKDFKTFLPLSEVYPEKKYNWLTAEVMIFKRLDGQMEQGVLYKPEDFDPNRKYPVILHYYSRKSQEANTFHAPGRENGHLDIAWFVSRGYLVFTPDIHYKIGELGQSAVNSVVGAAKHLSQFSWVDAKKMGLQGHSLGGYETNYIITQTNLFAAACSSSGLSDIISNYLGFLGLHTNHDWYENRICRIGATLWEKPDLYIKNSPVFQLDKVTTPLLTVANKNDLNVSFDQGVALFTALRRLGKKVWMLQYDEGDHGVDGKSRIDYTLRMTQFFDHYLKGAPAPRWMTRGIPAKLKGIDNGLTLDAAGIEPPAALLIKK